MSVSAQQQFVERERRISEAIALGKPDRTPVIALFGTFPARYYGLSCDQDANDTEKCLEANFRANVEFPTDAVVPSPQIAGRVLGALGFRQLKWAGHGLPANLPFQAVEDEWMKAEEYDELIYDPSDFVVRRYWPRVCEKLAVLQQLPPLRHVVGYFQVPFGFMAFGLPQAAQALEALSQAGREAALHLRAMEKHVAQLRDAGLPMFFLAGTGTPFDLIGDFLRGRKGMFLDMFRRPQKLLAAIEKMLPTAIEIGVMNARMSGSPRVFIAIHGGIEGFMSLEQYRRFYWPTFRALMVALIEHGLTPVVLVEGGSTSRLSVMKEVPAGKVCYIFQDVDMLKAKEVLGGTACIAGNVPLQMLTVGSPDDVEAYCRRLLETVGQDGGFILSSGGAMDDARPENIRAMIESVR